MCPAVGAIMRPALAEILAKATRASGTNVRLGATFTEIGDGPNGARVTFSDGAKATYDLVVGADGLYSENAQDLLSGCARAPLHRPVRLASGS